MKEEEARPLPMDPLAPTAAAPTKLLLGWKALGLTQRAASILNRADIRTPEELAAKTREELISIPGLTDVTVKQCEALLGRPTPSALPYWTALGVPRPIAWRLSRHRVMHLADLRRLSVPDLRKLGFSAGDADALVALMAQGRFPSSAL
jgi:hypothetical protein